MLTALGVSIPGIEDFLMDEVMELTEAKAERILPGKIQFPVTPDQIVRLNYASRLAIRFLILIRKEFLDPISLERVKRVAEDVDWTSYFGPKSTFAVRTERTGSHNFTSVDAAAAIGEAIVNRFLQDKSVRIRANLKNPDVIVRAYISDNLLLLGLDTTGNSLHRRGYRVFAHRTSLNPTIAFLLVKLSGWLESLEKSFSPSPLVDPMCGGGTIPIEAVLAALNIPPGRWRRHYPIDHILPLSHIDQAEIFEELDHQIRDIDLSVICSDISPKSISGAIQNSKSAGVHEKIEFRVEDASSICNIPRIGAVATDPPYELRTGRNKRLSSIFQRMAEALHEKLELKFSAICAGPALPKLMLAMSRLKMTFSRRVRYGGIDAKILVYER